MGRERGRRRDEDRRRQRRTRVPGRRRERQKVYQAIHKLLRDERQLLGALRNLLAGVDFLVVDPEDEYRAVCTAVGGQHVRLASSSACAT